MSPDQAITPPAAPLQFDAADVGNAPPAVSCAACKRAITGEYYQLNDVITCARCKAQVETELAAKGSRGGRLLKATGLGLLGGLVGAAVWYVVLAYAEWQIGIIAVLVGFLAGRGVRRGSGGRGGRRYQVLAVAITWFSVGAVFVPFAFKGANEATSQGGAAVVADSAKPASAAPATPASPDSASAAAPATAPAATPAASADSTASAPKQMSLLMALGATAVFVLILPVIVVKADPLTVVFVAIALWEAWRQNRALQLAIHGPFQAGDAVAPAA